MRVGSSRRRPWLWWGALFAPRFRIGRFGPIWLEEGRRLVTTLLQFGNLLAGRDQVLQELGHQMAQLGVFDPQLENFFFKQHGPMNTTEVVRGQV
jgi:hypothetical protein